MKLEKPFLVKSRHNCFSTECKGRISTHTLVPIRHGIKIGLYYRCDICNEAIFWGEAYRKNAGLFDDNKTKAKK